MGASCETLTRDVSGTQRAELPVISERLKTPCERPQVLPEGVSIGATIEDGKANADNLTRCANKHEALVHAVNVLYPDPGNPTQE